MDSYYCIVSAADDPVAELSVLDAGDDETALARALKVAEEVQGWERVSVYAGERVVGLVQRAGSMSQLPLAA